MVSTGVLASGSRDKTVRLWDLRTGDTTYDRGSSFTSYVLLPDVKRMTYNQSAFAVVRKNLSHNLERHGVHKHNGRLALPMHALRIIEKLV